MKLIRTDTNLVTACHYPALLFHLGQSVVGVLGNMLASRYGFSGAFRAPEATMNMSVLRGHRPPACGGGDGTRADTDLIESDLPNTVDDRIEKAECAVDAVAGEEGEGDRAERNPVHKRCPFGRQHRDGQSEYRP